MAYIQILLNSIVSGCLLALAAFGFSLIFRITRAFHLAQAGIYVSGIYTYIALLENRPGLNFGDHILALTAAMLVILFLAWTIEKAVYAPIFKRRGNETLTLIGSLGANAILINSIALVFGNELRAVPKTWSINSYELFQGIILTNLQIVQLATALTILLLFYISLDKGKSMLRFKAVADNSDLAEVSGLNVERIRVIAMLTGSLVVLTVAILRAYDLGTEPYAGIDVTLSAAVVAILTGNIRVQSIVIVAICLALLQNLIEWFLSAQWREGLTFLLMLVVMLWRTEGVLSYQIRKDA